MRRHHPLKFKPRIQFTCEGALTLSRRLPPLALIPSVLRCGLAEDPDLVLMLNPLCLGGMVTTGDNTAVASRLSPLVDWLLSSWRSCYPLNLLFRRSLRVSSWCQNGAQWINNRCCQSGDCRERALADQSRELGVCPGHRTKGPKLSTRRTYLPALRVYHVPPTPSACSGAAQRHFCRLASTR